MCVLMVRRLAGIRGRVHRRCRLRSHFCLEADSFEVCAGAVFNIGTIMLNKSFHRNCIAGLTAAVVLVFVLALVAPQMTSAHNVSQRDASFVESNKGSAIPAFMY